MAFEDDNTHQQQFDYGFGLKAQAVLFAFLAAVATSFGQLLSGLASGEQVDWKAGLVTIIGGAFTAALLRLVPSPAELLQQTLGLTRFAALNKSERQEEEKKANKKGKFWNLLIGTTTAILTGVAGGQGIKQAIGGGVAAGVVGAIGYGQRVQ